MSVCEKQLHAITAPAQLFHLWSPRMNLDKVRWVQRQGQYLTLVQARAHTHTHTFFNTCHTDSIIYELSAQVKFVMQKRKAIHIQRKDTLIPSKSLMFNSRWLTCGIVNKILWGFQWAISAYFSTAIMKPTWAFGTCSKSGGFYLGCFHEVNRSCIGWCKTK